MLTAIHLCLGGINTDQTLIDFKRGCQESLIVQRHGCQRDMTCLPGLS